MGIPGLWDIIGDGDVEALADIVTEHWRKHNRPYRIAVDEAGWRFNNLNDAQVARILESEPAANPKEKAILWRVENFLRHGIQPLFIFDGHHRPHKHGKPSNFVDYGRVRLLKKVLDHLKVRYHHAPGEAEAECARYQELGIVDAVWSDDGDSLMFGTTVLLRSYKDEKKGANNKSATHVRVYRADKIKQQFGFDKKSLVLFALLNGGDYNIKGLQGCGPKVAHHAVTWQDGKLSQALADTRIEPHLRQLPHFTEQLRDYFANHSSRLVHVPDTFPRDMHVKHYRNPVVSTEPDTAEKELETLAKKWDVVIDEGKLRPFFRDTFNYRAKDYIKHIVPVLLVKHLLKTSPDNVDTNKDLEIALRHKRGKTADDYKTVRLLTFNPLKCSNLTLANRPEEEDWSVWTDKKTGEAWNPAEHVEIEVLDHVLERGLGIAEMTRLKEQAADPKPQKRKNTAATEEPGSSVELAAEPSSPATKKQKTTKTASTGPAALSDPALGKAKRKKQSKAIACTKSPELGPPRSSTETTSKSKKCVSKPPASAKPSSSQDAPTNQAPVFRLPTALLNLAPAQREQLQRSRSSTTAPIPSPARVDSGTMIIDMSDDDGNCNATMVPSSTSDLRGPPLKPKRAPEAIPMQDGCYPLAQSTPGFTGPQSPLQALDRPNHRVTRRTENAELVRPCNWAGRVERSAVQVSKKISNPTERIDTADMSPMVGTQQARRDAKQLTAMTSVEEIVDRQSPSPAPLRPLVQNPALPLPLDDSDEEYDIAQAIKRSMDDLRPALPSSAFASSSRHPDPLSSHMPDVERTVFADPNTAESSARRIFQVNELGAEWPTYDQCFGTEQPQYTGKGKAPMYPRLWENKTLLSTSPLVSHSPAAGQSSSTSTLKPIEIASSSDSDEEEKSKADVAKARLAHFAPASTRSEKSAAHDAAIISYASIADRQECFEAVSASKAPVAAVRTPTHPVPSPAVVFPATTPIVSSSAVHQRSFAPSSSAMDFIDLSDVQDTAIEKAQTAMAMKRKKERRERRDTLEKARRISNAGVMSQSVVIDLTLD